MGQGCKTGPKVVPNGSSENYRKVSNGHVIEHVLVGQNRGSTPGSTRIRLTSKSPIPRDMIRASRCGCNIRVGSIGEKMVVPSIRWALQPVNPGQTESIRSRTNTARNNLCLFRLESYS